MKMLNDLDQPSETKAPDPFEKTPGLAESETDPGNYLLERWLRLAEAALKTKNEKDSAEQGKKRPS